ncbi:hypothetical protein [Candidatus Solirubrobacter pratensis]|uniref:hypothetical protein n=1 Tax=Candidatus Solirubrobacter pratensis TaxID=1298857 RepID=UPI00040215F0|nr:hypothetical protein [Candidatus Solirubrobacter pratensis]
MIPRRPKTTAVAAALALAACGGGARPAASPSSPARPATTPSAPALCGPLRSRVVAHVAAPGLTEASGLVLARGSLWTHDDSGGPATLFELSTRGKLLREVPVPGAVNVDWEDIAARGGTLYVADIGDNAATREEIAVYRIPPAPERIALRYPDGPHDAEALLVDGSRLVILTKSLSGESHVYTARGPGTLRRAGTLSLGLGEAVTGADARGRTIVVRTYDRVYVWMRRAGESIARALRRKPCTAGVSLLREGQGESIALAAGGRSFYTLPEGSSPVLREYAVSQH